jgi:hypothetical protein
MQMASADPTAGALIVREVFKGDRHPGEPFRFRFVQVSSGLERYLLFVEPDERGRPMPSVPLLFPPTVADSVIFCAKPGEWWPDYRERARAAIQRQHPRFLRSTAASSANGGSRGSSSRSRRAGATAVSWPFSTPPNCATFLRCRLASRRRSPM